MVTYSFLNAPYTNFSLVQETRTKISYPLSLSEVKRHLRVDNDFTDDDSYLEGLIEAGTLMAENYIEKSIGKTQVDIRIDDFNDNWVRINDGNFISIISVKDYNDASIGTIHQTSKHDDFFQIEWTDYIVSNPLNISYYAGFNVNETPALIKQAILIKIADLYDSARSDYNWSGMQDNKVFEQILNFYKMIRF